MTKASFTDRLSEVMAEATNEDILVIAIQCPLESEAVVCFKILHALRAASIETIAMRSKGEE